MAANLGPTPRRRQAQPPSTGKRVRSIPHALDAASGERFIPIAKIEPKNEQRLSDYAFETAG